MQRASAAGNWMVGPPSSWSLRDQEDASWQVQFADRPRGPSHVSKPPHASSSRGILNTWQGVARISSRPPLALAPILSAIGTTEYLATPLITQLTDRLSELAGSRRRDAIEDRVRSTRDLFHNSHSESGHGAAPA